MAEARHAELAAAAPVQKAHRAEAELDRLAASILTKFDGSGHELTAAQAMTMALETDAGAKLYESAFGGRGGEAAA